MFTESARVSSLRPCLFVTSGGARRSVRCVFPSVSVDKGCDGPVFLCVHALPALPLAGNALKGNPTLPSF
jgi:hypothetical protein